MLKLVLAALSFSTVLAFPAPVAVRDFRPVVRALNALAPAVDVSLARRQSTSDALNGLEGLLEKAASNMNGGQCASECSAWVEEIYDCSDAATYTQVGICACGSDQTAKMRTCGTCYGGSDEQGANDFSDYCADALDTLSSASSRIGSSTSGTGSASRTSAFASATSAFASATSTGSSEDDDDSSIGGGILSDINSATSRAPVQSATNSGAPQQGGNSAAGTVRAGGAAFVGGVLGGALVVLAL
ncbi:hypothetical protein JCM3775_000355 [Rhodotorula graminis]